ncbi:MAG: hypothetical protein IPM82_00025 [Saprospiraceae bacterium]|nr:hypothetical protein [Saprospiraceae bacterium]
MNKYLSSFICGLLALTAMAQTDKPQYPIQPIPFTDVKITDHFWAPRLETVRTVTLPYTFQQCEETGRVKNFDIAGGNEPVRFVEFTLSTIRMFTKSSRGRLTRCKYTPTRSSMLTWTG